MSAGEAGQMPDSDPYAYIERLIEADKNTSKLYWRLTIGVGVVVCALAAWLVYVAGDPKEPLTLLVSAASPVAIIRVPWQRFAQRRDRAVSLRCALERLRVLDRRPDRDSPAVQAELLRIQSTVDQVFMRLLES